MIRQTSAGILAAAMLAGCASKGEDSPTLGDWLALGLDAFIAVGEIVGEDKPDALPAVALRRMLAEIDRGLAVYCALNPENQALMVENIDPEVLGVAVDFRGGADGDVCTED